MNESDRRMVLVQILLVTVLAAGAWWMLVRPRRVEVDQLRVRLEQTEAMLDAGRVRLRLASSDPAVVMGRLEERTATLARYWSNPIDASSLYELYRGLAAQHDVDVRRMEPSGRKGAGTDLESVSVTLEVEGTFGDIAALLASIKAGAGMAEVDSFRIMPTKAKHSSQVSGSVFATLTSVHYRVARALPGAAVNAPEGAGR